MPLSKLDHDIDLTLSKRNSIDFSKEQWYDNPALQAKNSSETEYSSLCSSVLNGVFLLMILPIILFGFIFWIFSGFGYFYEQFAENRDRKKYSPPMNEMKPWGPDNTLIHVVHLPALESKLPPIVYVSGLGATMMTYFKRAVSEPML